MCLNPVCQFKLQNERKEKHTSSLSCLVKDRRTNAAGSIFPGGRPMPNKINNKMTIDIMSDCNIDEYFIPKADTNLPILKRGKAEFPFK
jgi:hypothetical protein